MHRFLCLLTIVLIVCLVQTVEARKLALLVGVDEYVNVPSLKCCVNDMKALREALMKIGFEEDDIQMLVTGGAYKDLPTKKNIERRISTILLKAQKEDMVFIALSGHGAQDGKNVYFCPPDVEIEDLKGTCVSINNVMDILANTCKAKFKWMVIDACRNDPTRGAKGIGGKGLQVIPTPPAGIALFQSCAEGEESWEDRDSGNGYFTKNFAAALSGEADANHDGKLTLMEVFTWTTAHTKEQVKNNQNKSQRPYFSGSFSDFTLSEDLNVPKAKKLVEEARKAMDDENYAFAVKKFDESIALCPRDSSIRRERDLANKLLIMSQASPVVERPSSPSVEESVEEETVEEEESVVEEKIVVEEESVEEETIEEEPVVEKEPVEEEETVQEEPVVE
ncbi:MAG: caspase family protein, partial [Thermoguttaceae bacterium]|nr:caspase family protein [Thermoguttaceae bacterium]